ncbi:hypothetical protein DFH08DRAFT_802559 [Mycena albidolilacea]|uniref:Uncharacterized protein n=1 Tax=Mycena albidolilacea TaxID=1033008 RepID=A0AAD7EXC8_9AGAR|nr:hypothetical protein DFH08DRAFT_802559 [Mycena albidolilacea]
MTFFGVAPQNLAAPIQYVPYSASASRLASLQLQTLMPTFKSTSYVPLGETLWVNVDFGDSQPSELAYTNLAEQHQFGMLLNSVLALEPLLELFVWPEESLLQAEKSEVLNRQA